MLLKIPAPQTRRASGVRISEPLHTAAQKPYYFVQLTNLSHNNAVLYQDYRSSGQAGSSGSFKYYTPAPNPKNIRYEYRDWQLVDIDPTNSNGPIGVGDVVKLEVIAAGCSLGDHYGQVYVDGVGSTLPPGLFVVGSTNKICGAANTDLTYTITYKNTDAADASDVSVDFGIPTGTTYLASSLGTCFATPAASPTLVTCPIGALPSGASGSFTITVHIKTGTNGLIVADSYSISAAGGVSLLGPNVITSLTSCCTTSADCSANAPPQFCNVNTHACTGVPCAADAECGGAGAICHVIGACGSGCRGGASPVGCAPGKACTSTTSAPGVCNNACTSDTQCGPIAGGIICNDVTHLCATGCRGMGGNGCKAGFMCSSVDTSMGTCSVVTSTSSSSSGGGGCIQDSNCGVLDSGIVCNNPTATTGVCQPGCRGKEGNGCPVGEMCSSLDGNIGTCSISSTTSSSSSSSTVSSSSTASSSSSSSGMVTTASSSAGGMGGAGGSATTASSSSSSTSSGSVTTASSAGGMGGAGGSATTASSSSSSTSGSATVSSSSSSSSGSSSAGGMGGAGGSATTASSSSSSTSGSVTASSSSSSSSGSVTTASSSAGGMGGAGGSATTASSSSSSSGEGGNSTPTNFYGCATTPGPTRDSPLGMVVVGTFLFFVAGRRRKGAPVGDRPRAADLGAG